MDVGGQRKRFDIALIDNDRLLALEGGLDVEAVLQAVDRYRPSLIAIDSPRCCAPVGTTARGCELQLARAVCGIRWTPDEIKIMGNPYYAWIAEGLALYEALATRDAEVIEAFPTASWTRWFGPRGKRSRADWTRAGLARLGVKRLPPRTNQDQRDAIAAAVTARQHQLGATETMGEIVIPAPAIRATLIARSP